MGKERKEEEGGKRKRTEDTRGKIYQIGQHTAMDLWISGYEGKGNGEETAGSLCRYTVAMMYLSGMSGMRGQRESTERYLMRCRLHSFTIRWRKRTAVPRLSHPSVRSQLSQFGLQYGKGTWAILAQTGLVDKELTAFPMYF